MCAPEVPPAREMELSEPTGGGLRKSVRNGRAGQPRPSSSPARAGTRIVDHLDRRLVNLLTPLGFALPVAGYFWFLERYSVDAVVGDQWDLISMIKQSYVQFFPWNAMWSQHNENRIFFPNMIVLLLVHTDHFDIRTEQYLGALMLVAAVIFILWAHKRRSPSTPWLYYCPVVFLAFSVVQYGNTIWGFQLAWYVVLLCMAATLLLLDRVVLGWVSLVGATAVAVLGSFSSLQGLLIWPTGLVLLYYRRRSPAQFALWVGVAIATTALYFRGYKSTTPGSHLALEHPLVALKFFLLALGDVVGKPITNGPSSIEDTLVMLFGLAILLLAVGTVLICGLRRDEQSGAPIGIALICYGLLFAGMITQGRLVFGYVAASYSRYTTFDVLVVAGIYLSLLDCRSRVPATDHPLATNGPDPPGPLPRDEPSTGPRVGRRLDRVALPFASAAVLVAIALQIPFGIYNGVQGARVNHAQFVAAAVALKDIDHVSNSQLIHDLLVFKSGSFIRQQAQTLEEHHLSVFANG